ncbi:hypothetical protein DICSQDRAFT_141266 [Dichomitus squalens LYAD-421 SS1]|uniref:Uncharacterized protein n=1 Tax=Dichomitus squalens (strain LYAD-421) TaxID=732165 RepID=R7SKK9_DICSQ|nr:uncharacterized protein DICSQDRAFT_141266 [Dichomitus squalens LYAD-421 SS1]EJF56413.1 hypothetical protein DICSQDRAFT_141266 [Dichomitus squalens LYAD-421 SS1]
MRRSSSSHLSDRWHELGWNTDDSELTPLEDSSDEGESEIDLPESDEEQDAEDAGTRKLSIKIPQRPPPKHRWQCRTLGCANLLTQGTHWKNCDVCRTATHRLRKQERLQMRDNIMGRAIANAVRTAVREEETTSRRKRALPMAEDDAQEESGGDLNNLGELPAYQHFAALLESLCTRFAQFKDVQTRYVQLKALSGAARKAMVFKFGGEYSVVADPTGGSVDALVGTVIRNIQAALGLTFRPAGFLSGPEDSVVAVLSCEFVAWIPLVGQEQQPAATPQPGTAAQASDKADSAQEARMEVTMTGELHVCVAWDRRHKFFPGQRIIIRFKLVG